MMSSLDPLKVSSYYYDLPPHLIASTPSYPKDEGKLLIYERATKKITHTTFGKIFDFIPKDTNIVYICGGYIETIKAYNNIKDLNKFKKSLINHSKKKTIYAECAGLLYLGNRVDDKKMTGILDIDFTLDSRFNRLGYYYNSKGIKGHSFHYTKPLDSKNGFDTLSKSKDGIGKVGSWRSDNKKVFGTYLHTMFRNNTNIIKDKF